MFSQTRATVCVETKASLSLTSWSFPKLFTQLAPNFIWTMLAANAFHGRWSDSLNRTTSNEVNSNNIIQPRHCMTQKELPTDYERWTCLLKNSPFEYGESPILYDIPIEYLFQKYLCFLIEIRIRHILIVSKFGLSSTYQYLLNT